MNRTQAPTAAAEQRLRMRVGASVCPDCGNSPFEPDDCDHIGWTELDKYRDFIRVCAVAELGCRNKSKRGTCVDKGFKAICFACQAEVERDRIVVAVLAL